MEAKSRRTSRRPSRRALLVLLMAVMLLLAAMGLYQRRTAWLADHCQRDLSSATDEQLRPRLRRAADLGEPGIAILAAAIDSPRQALAEASAEVLDEELHRWLALPPAETLRRRLALAEALVTAVDRAGPDGRARAAGIAQCLLRWPADARAPATGVTLACERILNARPSDETRRPPSTTRSAQPTGAVGPVR